MKKLLFGLLICTVLSCKKDVEKTLTENSWVIESVKVNPALTIGSKTSTDYLELSGPESCAATATLSFLEDGTYLAGASGSLCDLMADARVKTWKIEGNQILLSVSANAPLVMEGKKLKQTLTSTYPDGKVYTFLYIYKSK